MVSIFNVIKYRTQILGVIATVLFLLSCKKQDNKKVTQSKERLPNIIYILADDLGYGDLSCYGQEKFNTPNIDKLASKGLLFTQHYAGSTVCAPSRSALLTGLHTGHTPIRGNKEVKPEGQHPIPDDTFTLAEALKKGGYVTGAFGKWGLGYPGSEGDPLNQGFDVFFGFNCQRLGHHYYPYHLWSNKDSIVLKGNVGHKKEVYAPTLIHKQSLEFLERNKDTTFFMYVPTIIPHAELVAPDSIMAKYKSKYLPEKHFKGTDGGAVYRQGSYESQPDAHAAFVAMIEVMDNQVGEIIDKLKTLGIEENTLVIFTSDNGPHTEGGADPKYFNSNGPLKGTKRDLYEGGIRVPMIAKWPGKIKAGRKTDLVSAFWDVFPTFSEIAELPIPNNLDGISFLPTLLNNPERQKHHEYLYWEFHEKGGRQAVRKGDWKAVKYNVLKHQNAPIQLYNLSEDIGEEHNVAKKYPEVVKDMEGILKEARTQSDVYEFDQVSF
ncbi:arylsulfatase [Algibacter amylolyticus]|uniref:Arylsulfatase n=1 Tax=Algibacter amylolyticus TaxID=1608400 RepID=A0A5M7B7W0_9FLAO|nr:arylsulfatase [Algibacter amylolyticus]KAA5823674.1 arylsulfatase [Algibacter amylolyticus]MBB5267840.1 arylsulfatase A-like enzyme [Algibacter amylolyticus]TSJ74162.1 arylsulfatase [Algibacter amylolyticus]